MTAWENKKDRLFQILNETTIQVRKGEEVQTSKVGQLEVIEIFAMPHVSDLKPGVEKIDMELLVIGVDRKGAEKHKDEFIKIMNTYPEPTRLAGGPSYIEMGAVIGDQGMAFQLFAFGAALGLWKILTPATFGLKGDAARQAAGNGFVMMSGYKVSK